MSCEPVNVLKRVINDHGQVLNSFKIQMQARRRWIMLEVCHVLNHGEESIVTQQDTEVTDGTSKVFDVLSQGSDRCP